MIDQKSISFEEKLSKVEEWTTEIKKTLQNGGIVKNLAKLNNLVRQRYPLR
jgi:hypothetical protein